MLRNSFLSVVVFAVLSSTTGLWAETDATKPKEPRYQVWVEDSLVKVMQNQPMPDDPAKEIELHMARGEYEDAQIVVRPLDNYIHNYHGECSVLKQVEGNAAIEPARVRIVDYVPLRQNCGATPVDVRVAQAPAWVPDPLYEIPDTDVWKGKARPLWLTFYVPRQTPPGLYSGQVQVTANQKTFNIPVKLQVYSAVCPAERTLKVTNWIMIDMIAHYSGGEPWSEDFWESVRKIARNMAEHRQNMILCPIPISIFWSKLRLIEISPTNDGKLQFGFSRFDQWVRIFKEEGVVGYIEGGHIGHNGMVHCWLPRNGEIVYHLHPADTPEAEEYLSQLFTALQAHVDEKGWTDIYYQHVMDEPNDKTVTRYNAAMDLVRKHAPRLKTMDALLSSEVTTADVLVPILKVNGLPDLAEDYEHYKKLQQQGKEVWYYFCGAVQGTCVSRHLDQKMLRVRYTNWLNFKYNLSGFLHWGYNWWGYLSPFTQTQVAYSKVGPFPPTDQNIVYPAPDGGIMDSIRHEADRDSIEDYELLKRLKAKSPAKARAIADKLIRDFDEYEMNVAKFRAARRELLKALCD